MKDIIKSVTRALSMPVAFYFGNPSENNLALGDEESEIIGVLLPYDKEGQEEQTGMVTDEYHLSMLFLKRSDLDLDFDTRYDNYLNPMEALADEFYLKLKSYMESEVSPKPQKAMSNKKVFTDQINLHDVNYDGAMVTFSVPKRLDISYCLNNYVATISSDGSAVTNDLTWLHNIDEVSADGVSYGATASFSGTGWTFDISAGSLKTGSYTFTPSINDNYTFKKDFWIKWSDGVTTKMRMKVVYSYVA